MLPPHRIGRSSKQVTTPKAAPISAPKKRIIILMTAIDQLQMTGMPSCSSGC